MSQTLFSVTVFPTKPFPERIENYEKLDNSISEERKNSSYQEDVSAKVRSKTYLFESCLQELEVLSLRQSCLIGKTTTGISKKSKNWLLILIRG